MSQQNAVKFLQASGTDPNLIAKLAKAERTVASWLKIAAEAGFEVTPDELKAVAEALLHGPIKGDAVAALTAQDLGAPGGAVELGDKQLGAVAGGVGAGLSSAGLSSGLMSRVGRLGGFGNSMGPKDSGPTWVNQRKDELGEVVISPRN
jgi:predicted ribosomally synthesized peptide with nif11-like leader